MAKQAENKPEKAGKNGVVPPREHRFKKGESGNPKGRPKGTGITDKLREIVFKDDGKVAEELADMARKAAMDGDYRFWNAITERLDGKVPDKIEGTGEVTIRLEYVGNDDTDTDEEATPGTT